MAIEQRVEIAGLIRCSCSLHSNWLDKISNGAVKPISTAFDDGASRLVLDRPQALHLPMRQELNSSNSQLQPHALPIMSSLPDDLKRVLKSKLIATALLRIPTPVASLDPLP
jgi:hypothetical protein